MTHTPLIKICGIKDKENLDAATNAGADMIGLVFYPPSPRYISFKDAAALIKEQTTPEIVALFVEPSDKDIKEARSLINVDRIQLHGNESPERVTQIKSMTGLPVMKALRIAEKSDLNHIQTYEAVSDWFIFDSKPATATLPGGTGHSFDWSLLKEIKLSKPWMLSGGLNVDNIADVLSSLNPDAIDVSSGVEDRPGYKSPQKIAEFIKTARAHSS